MFNFSPDYIGALIAGGESELVEFKRYPPNDVVAARILTAFANTKGGTLIVGITEEGEPTRMSYAAAEAGKKSVEAIGRSLTISMELGITKFTGAYLVIAHVYEASVDQKPVATAQGDTYVRHGTEHRQFMSTSLRASVPTKDGPEKTVFVAMSFREEQEPSLVDYFKAIERAAKRAEVPLKVSRIDMVEGDFEISQQVMNEIDKADIVLADFTLSPHNVYFEVGYARGMRKRIVQTARKGTVLEFDARNWRTLFYVNATQLEERLVGELEKAYHQVG